MSKDIARCACGQLRVAFEGPPRGVGLCHCLDCQRRTGSVFAAIASYPPPKRIVGETAQYVRTGDAGATFTFTFCPRCGSTVFHTERGREHDGCGVAVGALEGVHLPPPDTSVYDRRRRDWVHLPDGAVAYDGDPDD